MSDFNAILSRVGTTVLKHYGVKGMRWGKRKGDASPTDVTVKSIAGKRVRAEGGKNQPASEDAKAAAALRQKAKASTPDALSNKELQQLVTRMNLEQQLSKLSESRKSPGAKFVSALLGNTAKQQATRVANDAASKQVGEMLKKKAAA